MAFDSDMTIVEHCLRHAAQRPAELAFRYLEDGEVESATLTYAQLAARAHGIAARLAAELEPGERVILAFQPGLDFIAAFYGCLFARMIAVPCYPPRPRRAALEDLRAVATNCGARLVLANKPLAQLLPKWLRDQLAWTQLRVQSTDDIPDLPAMTPLPRVLPSDVAFLQYTSGSTGAPKGVVVQHRHVVQNLEMIREAYLQGDHTGVSWLPPYHDMGLIGGVLLPVFVGGLAVLMPPGAFVQKPLRWLKAITEHRATISGGPNFAYELCVTRIAHDQLADLDLSRWRVAFDGAEPVRWSTVQRFTQHFQPCGFRPSSFVPCYGMAETTLLVASTPAGNLPSARAIAGDAGAGEPPIVCCGSPAPRTRIRVVDPDTRRPLAEGQIGEIWVQSPSVAAGYWGDLDRTRDVFEARLADSPEATHLRTGDLGFLAQGQLYVTGRLKDLIIVRGRKLYAHDVERVAEQSHAALRQGYTAAFALDHAVEPTFAVLLEVERVAMRELDGDAVLRAVRAAISDAFGVVPDAIVLVKPGTIPLTSSGKVRRFQCRQRYLDGALEPLGIHHPARASALDPTCAGATMGRGV